MKNFKFRLQTVLEYRDRVRNDRKGELVKANQALSEAQSELSRLENLELQNTLSIQDVSPVSLVLLNAQIASGLIQRIQNQKGIIELREADVAKAMEAYNEASKDHKAVCTLKERKLQEFNKKVAEADAAYLDELSIMRAHKTNAN